MNYKVVFVLLILLYSCNKPIKNDDDRKPTSTNIQEEKMEKKEINIDSILVKIENMYLLSDTEYDYLFDYFKKSDESISEGLGYSLYEYFYKNESTNESLINYLKQKKVDDKEENVIFLLKVMCLEIVLNEYKDYSQLLEDFLFLDNNPTYKKIFEECLENNSQE